jgi:hypothetical protein
MEAILTEPLDSRVIAALKLKFNEFSQYIAFLRNLMNYYNLLYTWLQLYTRIWGDQMDFLFF